VLHKFSIFTISLLILITSSVFSPAYGELIHTFDDPTVTTLDIFGSAVSIDGNNVLVGAPADDTNGVDVGQAHLFDATTGALLQTFDDPTPTSFDRFGGSVSISGNLVLVGAFADDTNDVDAGQAHLFDATTGALLQTFDDPTPAAADGFGISVSIDGNNVLVGVPADDTNGFDVGQAHLFDATTGALLKTFDDPTPTTKDFFGESVSISGNLVLVGALLDDTNGVDVGQAHLFDATTGALLHTFDDPTPTTIDRFGSAVSIDGNNVLVGAHLDDTNGFDVGQAHLFDATTGALLRTFDDPTVTAFDGFGRSVSISGNNVLVGAQLDDTNGVDVGQAHLFDATTGALCKTFDDPTVTTVDVFGRAVSIDGNNVLVGAPADDTNGFNVGQAYLFDGICNGDDGGISPVVGGEIIPIETTSLILAGAQTFSWMIPVIVSVIGIAIVIARKF